MFHGVAYQFGDLVAFSRRNFHYQFIVNLQNDTALDVGLGQGLLGANHRDLHDVGGRSLNRCVECRTFGGLTRNTIGRMQGREVATPSENGFRIPLLSGIGHQRFKVIVHLAEGIEIPVFQRFRFTWRDLELLGETIRAQTIGQSVAHGFYVAALVAGDLVDRQLVDHRGHVFVEVGSGAERFDQRLITGQISHDAQLDL